MCDGNNNKVKLLCKMSVHSPMKGIIGQNVDIISKKYSCGVNKLFCTVAPHDTDVEVRSTAVKELTSCLEGGMVLGAFNFEEITIIRNYIACY